jgi:predicted dithiol-disulfide oxidoreductase (DUF899 family)
MDNQIEARIEELEKEIYEKKKQLTELRQQAPMQEVDDYLLKAQDGSEVALSSLFGLHNELVLIHNMGKGCAYCTLWADGFNGVVPHLENRAGFVVVSPDDPQIQKQFSESRGWKFRMLSGKGSSFSKDMGFQTSDGHNLPGVSTFHKSNDGKLYRVAHTEFGPGDDFCSIWHLFDLLPGGSDKWQPKFKY